MKLLRKTALVLSSSGKLVLHEGWLEAFNSQTNQLLLTRTKAHLQKLKQQHVGKEITLNGNLAMIC